MNTRRTFAWASALLLSGYSLWPCTPRADHDVEPEQEQERELTLEQLPAPVKATVLREAGEQRILEMEEVRIGERLYYEAEWIQDEMEVEIQVAPDGTLIGREVEEVDDGDEEPEHDD